MSNLYNEVCRCYASSNERDWGFAYILNRECERQTI